MASRSLGTLTLNLVAEIGGFTGPLEKARRTSEKQMRQLERDAQEAATGIATIATASAAAAAGIVGFTGYMAQGAKDLKNQAQLANASVEEFQRYAYASKSVGVEQGKLGDILKDVNDRVGDFMSTGGGEMKDFFEKVAPKVGVTADEFARLSGPQALQLYYDTLQKAGLSQQQMTFYMESMADETTALIPLLKDGGAGFAEMAAEAEALGIVLSEQQIESLDDLADQYDRVTGIMKSAGTVAAAELAPALSGVVDELIEIAKAFKDGDYDEQVELLTRIGTIAGTAATAYVAYRGALAAATIAQWAFNAAVTANPLGVMITVAGAAVGALITFSDELGISGEKAYQSSLDIDGLADAFEGLTEAQQEHRRAAIVGDLLEMRLEAAKLGAELSEVSELVRNSGQLTEQGGAMPIASPEDIERGRELRGELKRLMVEIGASSDLLAEYDAIMQSVGNDTSDTETRTRKQAEAINSQVAALELQAATVAMSANEATLYKLAMDGATDSQLAAAEAALATVAAYEAEAEAAGVLGAEVESIRSTLDEKYAVEQEYQERLKTLRDGMREGFIEDEAKLNELIVAATEERNERLAQIERSRYDVLSDTQQDALGAIGDAMGNFADIAKEGGKETFQQYKNLATGEALVATALAVTKALGAAPPPINFALAASVGALGAVQIAQIQGQEYAGMAHDGIDSVPQTGTWLLEKGERVTTAETSAKLDRTLDEVQKDRAPSAGSGGVEVTNVFQVSAGVAGTVRAEIMQALPMINEMTKNSVQAALNSGGAMSRAAGRRR